MSEKNRPRKITRVLARDAHKFPDKTEWAKLFIHKDYLAQKEVRAELAASRGKKPQPK